MCSGLRLARVRGRARRRTRPRDVGACCKQAGFDPTTTGLPAALPCEVCRHRGATPELDTPRSETYCLRFAPRQEHGAAAPRVGCVGRHRVIDGARTRILLDHNQGLHLLSYDHHVRRPGCSPGDASSPEPASNRLPPDYESGARPHVLPGQSAPVVRGGAPGPSGPGGEHRDRAGASLPQDRGDETSEHLCPLSCVRRNLAGGATGHGRQDLNLQPVALETTALPVELHPHARRTRAPLRASSGDRTRGLALTKGVLCH